MYRKKTRRTVVNMHDQCVILLQTKLLRRTSYKNKHIVKYCQRV